MCRHPRRETTISFTTCSWACQPSRRRFSPLGTLLSTTIWPWYRHYVKLWRLNKTLFFVDGFWREMIRMQKSHITRLDLKTMWCCHQGNCTSCEGRDDVNEFAHFCSALKILVFSENDSWVIYKLLAAILHLGNVDFKGKNSTLQWDVYVDIK